MKGLSLANAILVRFLVVFVVVASPIIARSDEPDASDRAPKKTETDLTIDPFVEANRALRMLEGIWEYKRDYTIESSPPRYPAAFLSEDGAVGFPIGTNTSEPAEVVDKKMSSHVRLDLRSRDKFRLEMVLTDHRAKTSGYTFGEGNWSLRGRLLVLTFILNDEIERMGFFIERLSDDQIVVRGVEDSVELFDEARGTFVKKDTYTSLSVPKGYSVEVDEASFGSAKTAVAEYLRANLKAEVEIVDD